MASSLKKKIQLLEQQASAWAKERDQELYESRSDEELLFLIAYGYFPQSAVCTDEPQIRQLTDRKLRTTITLERVK